MEYAFNTKCKVYPSGVVKQITCTEPIFKRIVDDDERQEELLQRKIERINNKTEKLLELYREEQASAGEYFPSFLEWMNLYEERHKYSDDIVRDDNLKRAQEHIFDIAYCNPDFEYFITLTLDGSKLNRTDEREVSKKLRSFLRNAVQRKGLKYLLVPEYHKRLESDGQRAIHMHGFINDCFEMKDSGHIDDNYHTIYNIPEWEYGWSTAIKLYGDRASAAGYVTKYISKRFRKIFGNFYYAGGHGLVRSPQIVYKNLDYEQINAKEFLKCYGYKYFTYDGENEDEY